SIATPAPATAMSTATPKAPPTTYAQLCSGLTWPHPIPAAVGLIFDGLDGDLQPLSCLDGVRGIGPDGTIVYADNEYPQGVRSFRIAAMSPPPGTPVGRDDPVTVQLVS